MKLIQDILSADLAVIKQELGVESPLHDNLVFKYSTPNEFINTLKALDDYSRYPFFFVNSGTVEYDKSNPEEVICSVGEIVIATKTLSTYSSEERDLEVFKPILNPFLDAFIEQMRYSQGAIISEEGKIKLHYFYGSQGLYGTDGNVFEDSVDAIQLLNYKFRILK